MTDQLPLESLLRLARREAEDGGDGPVPYLLALHERPGQEVFERAVTLVDDDDDTWRLLGVRILGQLGPSLPGGRRPFSTATIPLLRRRLRHEPEPGVLAAIIAALAFHNAGEALRDVLPFATHPDVRIRFAIAAGFPNLVELDHVEPAAAAALLRLCQDEDADVRFYALYAATREIADLDLHQVSDLAVRLMDDSDDQVRTMAAEHHAAIPAVRELLNSWNFQGTRDETAYDCLIRPILVGLACYDSPEEIRDLLDEEISVRFDTRADSLRIAEQLVGWWQRTATQ